MNKTDAGKKSAFFSENLTLCGVGTDQSPPSCIYGRKNFLLKEYIEDFENLVSEGLTFSSIRRCHGYHHQMMDGSRNSCCSA